MMTIKHILDVEKYIDSVDAVIFDLDDTLYSEKKYVKSGYQQVAEYFGKPKLADEMWSVFERGGQAIDEVLQKHDLFDRKEEALHRYRFQRPNIQLYPGVREMLNRIRAKKKLGIITDGRPEGQRAKLDALDLRPVIDEIIITDELGGMEYRKPNPLAFQLMSERFKVPLDRMVYVGDNPKKDFIAPSELGMEQIWFQNVDGLYFNGV